MPFYLVRSAKLSNKITEVTFLYEKENHQLFGIKQAKSNIKLNGTKLPVIRQKVLTMIKPIEVLRFSK